ncbi:MAG: hypothetical protein L0Y39_08005 [Methylococcaceae bacterium]|nr:hypothetical protein [Methylococcaceae bacterium]MCI0667661.1 hypothetical protein [Methylococcaceae bacterium]
MSKELSNETEQKAVEIPAEMDKNIDTRSSPLPQSPLLFNPFRNTGFFSFRYSYQEISASEGKTHVRARQCRYENGKLSSEEFEGTTDGQVYDQAVKHMQHLIADSMGFFLKSLATMMPFTSAKKDRD